MWVWIFQFPLCLATVSFSVLYTTRMGGTVLPTMGSFDCPVSSVDSCLGGAARRAAFFKNWRAQHPNTLIFDGGGAYFGRSFYSVFKVDPMASYMNAAGYDAVSLHVPDFHGTNVFLSKYLKQLKMPAVCSNIDVSSDPLLNGSAPLMNTSTPMIRPFLVFRVAGVKVGLVSMISSRLGDLSQPSPQTIINGNTQSGPSDSVRAAVAMLQIQNPDCKIIILLSDEYSDSSSYDDLRQVIKSTYEIDVVLTTSASQTSSQIPSESLNDIHQPVWVPDGLQVGGYSINCFNLTFDNSGLLVNKSQELIIVSNSTPQDPWVWNDTLTKAAVIDLEYSKVVGSSNISLTYAYSEDGPLKRVFADAFTDYCRECDFVIMNAGGFNTPLPQGNITVAQIKSLFPFDNQLSVFQLKGSFVSQAIAYILEFSFPVTAGLRFAWKRTEVDGVQVRRELVELEAYNRFTGKWGPLNTNYFYKIVTSSYLRGGGTGLTVFRDQAIEVVNGPIDFEVFKDYVAAHSPLGGESPEFFQECRNASLPLRLGAGDCLIVETQLDQADLNICPTNTAFCSSFSSPDMLAFIGTEMNVSCSSCSGVGECVDLKCVCQPPPAGHWKNIPIFRGPVCADIRTVSFPDPGLPAFLKFLGALTLTCSVAVSIALFFTRKTRIIRASSPLFGHLIALGGSLGGAGVILIAVDKSGPSCNSRIVVCVFAYALIFSSLFAKTYRTHKIFNQTKLLLKKITTFDLLSIVGVVLGVELVLLLAFFEAGLNPLVPEYFAFGEWSSIVRCHGLSGQSSGIYFIFILVFNGGLLFWGVYLAFKTRNVPMQEFNESKLIASSLYNTTVAGTLAVILFYALTDDSPFVAEAVVAVAIAYVCIFTVLTLYLPKFILILKKAPSAMDVRSSSNLSGSKVLDPLARENAILRSALVALDQDVEAIILAAGRGSVSVSGTYPGLGSPKNEVL